MEGLIQNNRSTAISMLSIFVMIIIVILGGTNIYNRIGNVRRKIDTAQGELNTLQNKVNILSDAQLSSVSDLANQASTTLPVNNPTLPLVINIRRINNDVGQLVIESMEVGTQSRTTKSAAFYSTTLKIEAKGTVEGLTSFIEEVSRLNPVTNIKSLSVRRNFGARALDAEIELISFWSPLPTQLSNVSQTIAGLTSREEQILGQVAQFSQPSFTSQATGIQFTPRANPFVLETAQ